MQIAARRIVGNRVGISGHRERHRPESLVNGVPYNPNVFELLIAVAVLLVLTLGLVVFLLFRLSRLERPDWFRPVQEAQEASLQTALQSAFDRRRTEHAETDERQRRELRETLGQLSGQQTGQLGEFAQRLDALSESTQKRADVQREQIDQRIHRMGQGQSAELQRFAEKLEALAEANRQQSKVLNDAIQKSLDTIRVGNEKKLDQMRQTVDEKLHGTLEKRLGESFKLVSERLEKVQHGLGEMQELAKGVGDLKRVMTNVKTRGTWGEYQLGNLLEQVLTAGQYEANVAVNPASNDRVEFAIKLPGGGGDDLLGDDCAVWLPIDAKFPQEDYLRLQEAADAADAEGVLAARNALVKRVASFAADISGKYVAPPHTTNFALLFLPTEGLYAELARVPGLIERLQSDHRVTLAGPSTLLAQLNALQMGFRTLAIQERSSEVWEVLGKVKTEFGKFGDAMGGVKKKLQEAQSKIESVEVRTRAMTRQLKTVEAAPEGLVDSDADGLTPQLKVTGSLEPRVRD